MNKEIRMTVRLTPAEHARITEAARLVDRSVSSYVRVHLLDAVQITLQEARPSP